MDDSVIETIIKCFATSILLVDLLGIFGNVNLIVATVLFKQLRMNKCSLLIGLIAVCDLISTAFGIQAFIYDMVHKHDLLLYRNECFDKIWMFVFISCFETFLMFFLALDRLLAIAAPIFYQNLRAYKYFPIIGVPGILFGTAIVVLEFTVNDGMDQIQFCLPPTSLRLDIQAIYALCITVINCSTVVVYVIIGILIWRKTSSSFDTLLQTQIKVTKTIAFIVLFFILTWLAAHLISFIANVIFQGNMRRCLIHLLSMLPIHLNYAMNFYIYLWRNDTYRKLFIYQIKFVFNKIFCGMCCSVSAGKWAQETTTVSTRVQRISNENL
ncbi:hypothetical protein L596_013028 [Steinernema carpocapsae]|uniref:G-protein coupled receptors family 1 profile domain-containing protein n=1 Tax=Steinernema carpocapsae TaxID=34508 RepID=A0A4U5NYV3_STECR|nr:hypothetical protein L596_013028 [Steinernema carpocapsae]